MFLNYFLNAAYKIVYLYSCFEIYVGTKMEEIAKMSMIKNITEFFTKLNFPESPPIKQYLFIENGDQIFVYKGLDNMIFEPEHYDFILRNDFKNNMNYKILYDRFVDIGDYKASSVSFLSFVVFYQDKVIDILLETKNYSYMVVGNKINKKFIYYLLKNMKIVDSPDFEYTLQVVTHDVKILTLNPDEELVIGEKMVTIQNI
jgi:hypothetical protein